MPDEIIQFQKMLHNDIKQSIFEWKLKLFLASILSNIFNNKNMVKYLNLQYISF